MLELEVGEGSFRRAKLKIEMVGDGAALSSVESAMIPEADQKTLPKQGNAMRKRTIMQITLRRRGKSGVMTMKFASNDLASLRASFNTNLRLVSSALNTLDALSES